MIKTIERITELEDVSFKKFSGFGQKRKIKWITTRNFDSPKILKTTNKDANLTPIKLNEKKGLLNLLPKTSKLMSSQIVNGLAMMAEMCYCRMCFLKASRFKCC